MTWLLLAALALAAPTEAAPTEAAPTEQTVIYYNARMALREGRPLEATKLWLLRNAVEEQTHRVSPHDDDFRSVTWAALGDMGVCQDGFPTDEQGAGLWPLALHNWVVRNRSRRSRARRSNPYDSFELDRQQRVVSIGDVLGYQELRTVQLRRGACLRPRLLLLATAEDLNVRMNDPQVAVRLMRHLLERSRETLAPGRVRGTSTIEARLFDMHLQLTSLARREARRRARERARRGRDLGLSRSSVDAMRADDPAYAFAEDSEPALILRESLTWPASEWMALSPDRRLFLFDHARAFTGRDETLDRRALAIVDQLIEEGEGAEVERWIARCGPDTERIWGGARGERLLALDRAAGFHERSVLALHRGVGQLERGDLPSAMRSMAFALHHSTDSGEAEAVQGLSLRWLSHISAQFEITEELLATLRLIVSSREYNVILEDLVWSAAFRADRSSFERGMRSQVGRGALERRIALLDPLAAGDLGAFLGGVRRGLRESPSETMRFLSQLLQRLELEDADVRAAHLPTLQRLRELLLPMTQDGATGRQARTATELRDRAAAMVDGLGGGIQTADDRARGVDPDAEVYAGSVRLAPIDPLPWPFVATAVPAPSVFVPLELIPEEWRDVSGEQVFGWSLGE